LVHENLQNIDKRLMRKTQGDNRKNKIESGIIREYLWLVHKTISKDCGVIILLISWRLVVQQSITLHLNHWLVGVV